MKKLLFLSFLLLAGVHTYAQLAPLERIEPMNWWVGMNNPKLQLIVHGEKIAQRAVSLKYPGIKLLKVHKVDNPNYLFIDLEIGPAVKAGTFNIFFSKAGQKPYPICINFATGIVLLVE